MRKAKKTLAWALLACLALPALSRALELELEENRAQNGTIGFIDLDRIFQEYPETLHAKSQFETEVNTKRLDIQRRRHEILDMKEKLAELNVEREKLLKELLLEPAIMPAAAPAVAASTATAAAPVVSTVAVTASTATVAAPAVSTAAVTASTATVAVPIVSTAAVAASTAPVVAPVVSTAAVVASTAPAAAPLKAAPLEVTANNVLVSTAPLTPAATAAAVAPPALSTAALTTAASPPVILAKPPAVSTLTATTAFWRPQNGEPDPVELKVKDVDKRIDDLQKEIQEKDAKFQDYQNKVEADLRVLEKHRVKLLLGKIYDVVQEVAKDEGLSVVEDKKNILFGQDAVDLTDKVLARLKQE